MIRAKDLRILRVKYASFVSCVVTSTETLSNTNATTNIKTLTTFIENS